VERIVGNDLDVGDGAEPCLELRGEPLVDLDRDDLAGVPRLGRRQPAEPGSDLEDELVRADLGLLDELRGDRVATKEMLSASRIPARAPARVWRAHGPSP
jgi:hypothetical protein